MRNPIKKFIINFKPVEIKKYYDYIILSKKCFQILLNLLNKVPLHIIARWRFKKKF